MQSQTKQKQQQKNDYCKHRHFNGSTKLNHMPKYWLKLRFLFQGGFNCITISFRNIIWKFSFCIENDHGHFGNKIDLKNSLCIVEQFRMSIYVESSVDNTTFLPNDMHISK